MYAQVRERRRSGVVRKGNSRSLTMEAGKHMACAWVTEKPTWLRMEDKVAGPLQAHSVQTFPAVLLKNL